MSDTASAQQRIGAIGARVRRAFDAEQRVLSFEAYLSLVEAAPERFARNSAQYLLDALRAAERDGGADAPLVPSPDDDAAAPEPLAAFACPAGAEPVVGNARTQRALVDALSQFVRQGRVNRMLVIHGPNGSAKTSLVACLTAALEAYSRTDEGALYRFNWVFPTRTDGQRIGFGGESPLPRGASFAFLPEEEIDAKLPSEHNDNPLFLIPRAEREALCAATSDGGFVLSDTIREGDLGPRSRAIFDALLVAYRGDFAAVMQHVQVERFYISRRYRRGAVAVEPQLHVDAGARQLTVDRSLNALPRVLQSQTLFEPFGPLVEGNRGLVEYSDLLKRPLDANKYLLSTSEKGTVSLDTGELHIDAVLVATANEKYLDAFKQQPDWASYKGRMTLVRMPYLLDVRDEQRIYDAQVARLGLSKPIAPHTTYVLALWAVLTRLTRPQGDGRYHPAIRDVVDGLTPLEKARLYAGEALPDGLSAEQRQRLVGATEAMRDQGAERHDYEGRYGASPRLLKHILVEAALRDAATVSPLHVFEGIERVLADPSSYEWLRLAEDGGYHAPEAFLDTVRDVYLDRVESEVRAASGLVAPGEYERVFKRYLDHVNHWLRGERMRDAVTGDAVSPDESFMDEVEVMLGRDEDRRRFRDHLFGRVAAFRIDNPDEPVDVAVLFADMMGRIRAHTYASHRDALRSLQSDILQLVESPDPLEDGARRRAEQALNTLCDTFGYTAETASAAVSLLAARDGAA